MALLSQMIRGAAITGRTDSVSAWFADRQGRRWADQTIRQAFPPQMSGRRPPPRAAPVAPAPAADPAERLRELTELHERGAITSAELERLRGRLSL
jgi:hypothetical protein